VSNSFDFGEMPIYIQIQAVYIGHLGCTRSKLFTYGILVAIGGLSVKVCLNVNLRFNNVFQKIWIAK